GRTDIHSTNKVCHGNLPCPCDRQSSDCSVVRDSAAGGPKAHPRLLPEVGRAPRTAHRVWSPPDPVQRLPHQKPALNSRYKVGEPRASAAHLTLPLLRNGPLPLRPKGQRGDVAPCGPSSAPTRRGGP